MGFKSSIYGYLELGNLHPWKLTCPQKRCYFSREYIFQPLIFRGHVSFQGSTLHGSSTSQRDDEIWWSDNLWRYMMMISGYMMILWWPYDDTWLHHADLWSWTCVCVLYSKESPSCNQTNINQPSAGKDDLHMIDEDLGWHIIMYYL